MGVIIDKVVLFRILFLSERLHNLVEVPGRVCVAIFRPRVLCNNRVLEYLSPQQSKGVNLLLTIVNPCCEFNSL